MRTKKLVLLLIAVVFVLVLLFSCIATFTVKKIEIDFAVGDNTDTVSVQSKLDEFLGSNLLFLNVNAIEESLSDFYYMEVVSVKKSYPNVISVQIRERREVYEICDKDMIYVTTYDGFVLNSFEDVGVDLSRDKIRLNLNGVNVLDGSLGSVIKTDSDELISTLFDMAEKVCLTDCIKLIELEKATEKQNAYFYTYTGVKIIIREILDDGVKKVQTAFVKYDEGATDYEKTFRTIEAIKITSTGEIQAQWTEN